MEGGGRNCPRSCLRLMPMPQSAKTPENSWFSAGCAPAGLCCAGGCGGQPSFKRKKDLSSRGEAAQCAPRLKGLFYVLKIPQAPAVTGFSPSRRVCRPARLNALKRAA